MTDMTATIVPKSDQLNSDDLIVGPRTIKVTKVSLLAGEQPVGINYEGDNGKPYKPCKSMRRVLVIIWGSDSKAYVGRSMTLYRDESVMFGKDTVGGIRISYMSHIESDITLVLTTSRGRRKPYTVRPLAVAADAEKVDEPGFYSGPHFKMSAGDMKATEGYAASKGYATVERLVDNWDDTKGALRKAVQEFNSAKKGSA